MVCFVVAAVSRIFATGALVCGVGSGPIADAPSSAPLVVVASRR